MQVHPPDLSLPREPRDSPIEPDGAMVLVLAVALAILWLLVAVSVTLLVGGVWFISELIGQRGPAETRSVILLGGIAVSLVAYRLAWLLFDRPSSRIFMRSLIAAVVLLGLAFAVQLGQGSVSAAPDLVLAGSIALVSGLAVWQTR